MICPHNPAARHKNIHEGIKAQLQLEPTSRNLHFCNCISQTAAQCSLWQRQLSLGRIYLLTDRQQLAISLEDGILAASFLLPRNSPKKLYKLLPRVPSNEVAF